MSSALERSEAGMEMEIYYSTHASSFWMATGLATSPAAAMPDITPVWVSSRVSQKSSYASVPSDKCCSQAMNASHLKVDTRR